MKPMITTMSEVHAFKAIYAEVVAELTAEGVAFAPEIPLGAMTGRFTTAASFASDL